MIMWKQSRIKGTFIFKPFFGESSKVPLKVKNVSLKMGTVLLYYHVCESYHHIGQLNPSSYQGIIHYDDLLKDNFDDVSDDKSFVDAQQASNDGPSS